MVLKDLEVITPGIADKECMVPPVVGSEEECGDREGSGLQSGIVHQRMQCTAVRRWLDQRCMCGMVTIVNYVKTTGNLLREQISRVLTHVYTHMHGHDTYLCVYYTFTCVLAHLREYHEVFLL